MQHNAGVKQVMWSLCRPNCEYHFLNEDLISMLDFHKQTCLHLYEHTDAHTHCRGAVAEQLSGEWTTSLLLECDG